MSLPRRLATASERLLIDAAAMRATVVTTDTWDIAVGTDRTGYMWVLRKAVTYAHASIAPVNGQRVYGTPTPNATAGFIMNSLLTEAQARGALAGFTWTFTRLARRGSG